MHNTLRTLVSSAAIAATVLQGSAIAAGPTTTIDFYGRRLMVPGTWTVTKKDDSVELTKGSGSTESYLKMKKVKAEDCSYGIIRKKGLDAWGGGAVHQKDMRQESIRFRTSRYQGYKWIMPGLHKGIKHWCLGQEPKVAIEISAPNSDTNLVKYVDTNMILQMATRRGR